jgi:hypothetical protein
METEGSVSYRLIKRIVGNDPDFTLSNATVTTDWERRVVGTLTPVNVTEPVYFELVDDPAGFGVENG